MTKTLAEMVEFWEEPMGTIDRVKLGDKLIRQQAADIKVLREAIAKSITQYGDMWLEDVLAATDPNRVLEEV